MIPLIWYCRQPDLRKYAASLVVIALAFAVCIAPWMLRNYSAFGVATLGTNIGTNAYVGNHRRAPGGAVPDHWPDLPASANRNEAENDRALMRVAIEFVVANPGEAAAILPRKLMHLYLLETEVVTSLFQGERPSPAWVKYLLYGVSQLVYVFCLIVFGVRAIDVMTLAGRPHGAQWAGWLLAGYFTLLCLVFHGQDRYRLPILPWILVEGSVLLARIGTWRTKRVRDERPDDRKDQLSAH